ncbi:MAG: radical SAM protein [Treponema sp.]|jgi:hypothetical protein|nr:radical SAM protein [Treponema sp.]
MLNKAMLIPVTLTHGGIMVNYQCTAACRHCLYACSLSRRPGYISAETIRNVCTLLRKAGCVSVHIGGGEPFLNFEGLLTSVRELLLGGVNVDYVETNAFWAHEDCAIDKLRALLSAGVNTLCISIDPFHVEYVPYGYPLRLTQLCDKAGMGYFLWRQELLPLFSALSPEQVHDYATLKQQIGADYVLKTARAYGVHFGGRAINIEEDFAERKSPHFATKLPAQSLIDGKLCRNLLSGNHFHVDMEGYYSPPGCTGLRLPLAEVVNGISEGAYPAFEALYHRGLAGLLDLAHDTGFVEDDAGYTSKCALCFHVRRHLAVQGFAELDLNHYEEALKYY